MCRRKQEQVAAGLVALDYAQGEVMQEEKKQQSRTPIDYHRESARNEEGGHDVM